MRYDPAKHHRRSIRLKGYDYSQAGFYFVTICCYQRQCLFGDIVDGVMQLNQYGEIVEKEWTRSPLIRQEIELDKYVVMPNNFHAIVIINPVGANVHSPLRQPSYFSEHPSMKPKSLSSLIAGFKSVVTKKINLIRKSPGTPIWQRNYYEHIIRSEESLNKIREYVVNNPLLWERDQLHPNNPSKW